MEVNPLCFSDGLILDGDQNAIVVVYDHGQPTTYALECPRWIKYLKDRGLLDAHSINMPSVQDASMSDTSLLEEKEQCEEGVASSSSTKRKKCEPGLEEN